VSAVVEAEERRQLDDVLRAERKQIAKRALEKQLRREQIRDERQQRQQVPVPAPVADVAMAEPPTAPMAETPVPTTVEYEMEVNDGPDPIGEVMKLLQKSKLPTSEGLSILEEQFDLTSSTGPHGCTVRLKHSAECLGVSNGHKTKKMAKKVAYYLAYKNSRLHTEVQKEAARHAPLPAAPLPPSTGAATHSTLTLTQVDSNEPGLPLLPQPSRKRPAAQGGASPTEPTVELTDSQSHILEEILIEPNVSYQRKIAKLMDRSGRDDAELVALAQHMKALSSQGGSSAGRRFHDEIKAMCDATERGDLFLTSADMEDS
jgi:hypothetical protein